MSWYRERERGCVLSPCRDLYAPGKVILQVPYLDTEMIVPVVNITIKPRWIPVISK